MENEQILVDECDAHLLALGKWTVTRYRGGLQKYAKRKFPPTWKTVPMHRMIMGVTDPKVLVDHVNGNGLDNRRANLRIVDHSGNNSNKCGPNKGNRSGYRGVVERKFRGKTPGTYYQARSTYRGVTTHLGAYRDLSLAAAVAATWRAIYVPYAKR